MIWVLNKATGVSLPLFAYLKGNTLTATSGATNKQVLHGAKNPTQVVPSNDHTQSSVQLSAIANPVHHHPIYISIDTLRLVHHVVDPNLYGFIGQSLEGMAKDGGTIVKAPYKQARQHGYHRAFNVLGLGHRAAAIYMGRYVTKDSRQVALHIQPPALHGGTLKVLKPLMSAFFPGGMQGYLAKAHLSEIDIAIDVVGISLTDLIINHPHAQQWQKYGTTKAGVQTVYIGSSNSKNRWKIYDRTAHLAKKGHSAAYGSSKVVRLEKHMRGPFSVAQFVGLPNPLSDLLLYEIASYSPSGMLSPKEQALLEGTSNNGVESRPVRISSLPR